ncbi:MAG: hypothetical protein AAF483_27765 [Planctomycetota bacterium]
MSVESETVSLGKIKKELRPKRENVYAGYAIVLLLCVGGVYFIYTSSQYDAPTGGHALGTFCLIAAACMAWYVSRLGRVVVVIHELGFVVHRGPSSKTFPFDRIRCVHERRSVEGIQLAKGFVGAAAKKVGGKTTRSYTVVREDGEEFFFDDNVVPRSSLLAGPLRTAQRTHAFEWITDAI